MVNIKESIYKPNLFVLQTRLILVIMLLEHSLLYHKSQNDS